MKTTVDIPKKLLKEAMRHSGTATKQNAVLAVLSDYTQTHRLTHLREYLGKSEGFYTSEQFEKLRAMD